MVAERVECLAAKMVQKRADTMVESWDQQSAGWKVDQTGILKAVMKAGQMGA